MGLAMHDSTWTTGVNYAEDADIPDEENKNACAETEEVPASHADVSKFEETVKLSGNEYLESRENY